MKKLLLSSLMLLWCGLSYAACNYTYTVCPSGCDSNVLNTVVSTVETECASPSSPIEIMICGNSSCDSTGSWSSADTTSVGISGISTSPTNNLTIKTYGSARHNGVSSGSRYRLDVVGGSGINAIYAGSQSYVIFDGLDVTIDSAAAYFPSAIFGASYSTISNCIIHTATYPQNVSPISGSIEYLFNNIIYGFVNKPAIQTDYITVYIYNNTLYGNQYGLYPVGHGGTNVYAKNNIAYNNTTDYYTAAGGYNSASTNNLSKDATAPALGTYYRSKTLTFTNTSAGSENFHLASTDTDAIDKGADLGSPYNVDIDGATRSGTWDIGADEYQVTAATGGPSILRNSIIRNSIIR
jgi:hypothetical protein